MTKFSSKSSLALLIGTALLSSSLAFAAPSTQNTASADTTYDGLKRVEDSSMDLAWIKPEISLSKYTKIMLVPAQFSFKAVRDPGLHRSASEYPLSEKQKQNLRNSVTSAFAKELARLGRYQMVDQPGPDVLQVQGALLDVVSFAPPDPVGRGGTIMKDLGTATLVVELRDSLSNEILARAADRSALSFSRPMRSNSVNNLGEVEHAARKWAQLLNKRLDQLSSL